nr:MAG TPA: hypothetical protein [Caudoviricetes sp.]
MDLYYQKHPFTPLKPAYRAKSTSLTHPRWGMIGWTGSQLDARPESANALPNLAYHQSTKHLKT